MVSFRGLLDCPLAALLWRLAPHWPSQVVLLRPDAIDELKEKDYPFIGGARQFRDCEFAFIHPKKMNGVLLELIDYKWEEFKDK